MLSWITNLWKIERSRRLSFIFGFMIFIGLILVILGILASIKVTPYAKYTNKNLGFVIKFPAYWKPILNSPGAIVVFVAPKTNSLDLLNENFNITIKDMPQPMTFEFLSRKIINQVAGTFGDNIVISQSIPINLGGKPGYRLTFYGQNPKIPNPMQYVTAWTMVDNRIYILAFGCLRNDYPLFEKKVNTMIRSFKFISPSR